MGFSCSTTSRQGEALGDYYWTVQNLRIQAQKTESSAQALGDMGIIYLRTGHFREASAVFSQSVRQATVDPRHWFYFGLTTELIGNEEAALDIYYRSPTVTSSSIFGQAIQGRISWLEEQRMLRGYERVIQRGSLRSVESLPVDSLAVLPLICQVSGPAYAALGIGLSDLLSKNLSQLQTVDVVEPAFIRKVEGVAAAGVEASRRVETVGRLVGASKVLNGTCTLTGDRLEVEVELHNLLQSTVIPVSASANVFDVPELERELMNGLVDALEVYLPNRDRRIPLTAVHLDALAAYSQGIAQEEVGQFKRSISSFERALALDHSFRQAALLREDVQKDQLSLVREGEELFDIVERLEGIAASGELVGSRFQQLERTLGFGFVPSQGNRSLPPGNVGELPTPPSPVGNR